MKAYYRRGIMAGLKGVVYLAIGFILASYSMPDSEPEYRDVIVTRDVIRAGMPDTVVKWKERIVYRTVKAETIAVAPGGATDVITTFCEAAKTLPPNDSTPVIIAPVPMLFEAGSFDGKTLKLWEVRANGDAAAETFRTRSPFTFAVKDGRALVQSPRLWWVDDALKFSAVFAGGYVIGRIQ